MTEQQIRDNLAIVEIRPTDRILVRADRFRRREEMVELCKVISKWSGLPEGRVAVFAAGVELSILREESQ